MLIFIPIILLFLTALVLLVLRSTPATQHYSWLVAVSGALLTWLSTWLWLFQIPYTFELPSWQPAILFA
ncbi:MAG: monovalent cation/H+ antiporter subunit D, partial [Anaerolineae bacterium]